MLHGFYDIDGIGYTPHSTDGAPHVPVQHHHHHIPFEAAEPLPVSSIRSVNASRVEKQVREHARDSFDKLTAAPPRNLQHSHHHGAAGSSSSARFIRIARQVLSDAELWTEVLESPGFIEVSIRVRISLWLMMMIIMPMSFAVCRSRCSRMAVLTAA